MRHRTSRIWISSTLIGLIFLIVLLLPVLGRSTRRSVRLAKKLSPILQEEVASLSANPNQDYPMPVIIQVDSGYFAHTQEIRRQSGEDSDNALSLIRAYRAKLKAGHIKLLLESDSVEYVTLDTLIRPDGDWMRRRGRWEPDDRGKNPFLETIGADQVHEAGYTGAGVTVAVLDSGISRHPDIAGNRILAAVDVTSGEPVVLRGWRGSDPLLFGGWGGDDPVILRGKRREWRGSDPLIFPKRGRNEDAYGHGTHVAGILGGTGQKSNGRYAGVAPGVKFVDLKVIGEDGTG